MCRSRLGGESQQVANPPLPVCDGSERQKVPAPSVNLQVNVASATRAPWIVANGWRFLRNPDGKYAYDIPAGRAALAVAEAFAYQVNAAFKLDAADAEEAGRMLSLLRSMPEQKLPPIADFAFADDGSPAAGEAMNLLSRRNLLFAVVRQPDTRYPLNVMIGSADFPKSLAVNPSEFAAAVRFKLTDEKRSLRIYGTEMAIVRAFGDAKSARVHVLNYSNRPMGGIRLRVRGAYTKASLHAFGSPNSSVEELTAEGGFTEFSIPEMAAYAAVDLR